MPALFLDTTPLRVSPAYRRLWWGLGLSQIGAQVTVVAVGLEVYELTGSTFAVGLLGLAALIPLVVLGLYGGALADAFDRRKVALASAAITVLATSGLVLTHVVGIASPVPLYILTALTSAGAAISAPVRMAIIPRLIGVELLPAANALGTLTGSLALTVGPLLGALLAASVGFGWTYTLDLVLFLFALYALVRLPAIPPEPRTDDGGVSEGGRRRVGFAAVWEGLVFLKDRPNLRMTFVLDVVAMVTAMPRVLFPAVGAMIIGGGETTTGALTAAIAIGSVLASALSGGLGRVRRQGVAIMVAILAFGLCAIGFGVVLRVAGETEPDSVLVGLLIVAGLFLVGAGAADAISSVFRQTVLQSATPDHLRGRLQGIFIVVVAGGPRLGDLVLGGAADRFGEALAAIGGGLVCVVLVLALCGWQRGFLRYDARHPVP